MTLNIGTIVILIQIPSMAWVSLIQILHNTVFDILLPIYMMQIAFRQNQIFHVQNDSFGLSHCLHSLPAAVKGL